MVNVVFVLFESLLGEHWYNYVVSSIAARWPVPELTATQDQTLLLFHRCFCVSWQRHLLSATVVIADLLCLSRLSRLQYSSGTLAMNVKFVQSLSEVNNFHYFALCKLFSWLYKLVYELSVMFFLSSCLRMFNQNFVAQLWYFVKCIYFGLSAYQIRCGYPTRILGNFLTKKYNHLNLFLFQGYVHKESLRFSVFVFALSMQRIADICRFLVTLGSFELFQRKLVDLFYICEDVSLLDQELLQF